MYGDRNEHSSLTTLLPWGIPLALLLAWAIVSGMEWVPAFLLPPPQVIARTAYIYIFGNPGEGSYAGRFFNDAGASSG